LLADLSDDELKDVLPNKLVALTPHTITDKQALRIELASVRQQGWAQSWEELELGLAAIGAPIRGRDGNVTAAVSVSGPTVRIDQSQIKNLAILVMDTCRRISRDGGFVRR
jgi:DNA-binding IclR family transcriptional regulator